MNAPRAWLLALLAATAAATVSLTPAHAADQAVRIVDFAFTPGDVTVGVNERVQWTNASNSEHTVTSDAGAFDSGGVVPAQSYVLTIQRAGDFPYHCRIHPAMKGVVHAGGGATPTTAITATTAPTRPPTSVTPTIPQVADTTTTVFAPTATTSSTTTTTVFGNTSTSSTLFTSEPPLAAGGSSDDNNDDTKRRVAGGIAGALVAAGVAALILVRRGQEGV